VPFIVTLNKKHFPEKFWLPRSSRQANRFPPPAEVAQPGAGDGDGGIDSAVYELCTSGGFSGLFRHFRPLKALQFTDSAWVAIIVVRILAGEPPLISIT
jgi:hypothetical protein